MFGFFPIMGVGKGNKTKQKLMASFGKFYDHFGEHKICVCLKAWSVLVYFPRTLKHPSLSKL